MDSALILVLEKRATPKGDMSLAMEILYFSFVEWDSMIQRHHLLTSRLARDNRVLFIDPPVDAIHYFRRRRRGSFSSHGLGKSGPPNLSVLRARPSLPFKGCVDVVNHMAQRQLMGVVAKAAEKLSFTNPVLWLTLPTQYYQIGHHNESIVCYDCMDPYAEATRLWNHSYFDRLEQVVAKRVDVILATAGQLHRRLSRYNRNTHLVPNGVEADFFARAVLEETPVHPSVANLRQPVIGYIGKLTRSLLDVQLLDQIALAKPEWSFAFVGPRLTSVGSLSRRANVALTGALPYADLPGVLKGMDVCLIPFRTDQDCINPSKGYQYLAGGKPVVSTPFAEVDAYRGLVRVAGSAEKFVQEIEEALGETGPSAAEHRMQFARQNSWDVRAKQVEDVLKGVLRQKTQGGRHSSAVVSSRPGQSTVIG